MKRLFILLALAFLALGGAPAARASDAATTRNAADFATANALFAAGDLTRALPLYDALVSTEPRNPVYRLALARALLIAGQQTRAQHHLLQVRGSTQLAPEERAALERILARFEREKRHEGWLRFAIVPESNPGQRSDPGTVNIGGFDFALNPGGRTQPATGLHLNLGGALLPRIGPALQLRIGAGVDARLFRDATKNDVTVHTQFGLRGTLRNTATWEVYLSARDRRLGNTPYGRATGLHGSWSQMIGQRTQVQLRADVEQWQHPGRAGLDGTRQTLSLSWTRALRPDLVVRGTVFTHRTDARAAFEAGQGVGVSLGVQRLFQGGLLVSLDLTHQRSRRDAADPIFGQVRADRRSSLTARVLHRGIAVHGFAPALELGFERQTSTLALYRFRNARVSVGFSREF